MRISHAQFPLPMALFEKRGKHTTERAFLIKETHATNADRMIATGRQPTYDIGGIENKGGISCGFATRETSCEEPGMQSWRRGSWEKASEEGLVRGIGEAARGMTRLPTRCGEQRREKWRTSLLPQLLRHVITQRIQRDKKNIMCAN